MTLEKVLLYAETHPDASFLQIQPTRNDQPTQPSNTPLLHSSKASTRRHADTFPLLPRDGQIAIEFGLLRLTENADSSVMCLDDLASD
jgi:hypothetical protein